MFRVGISNFVDNLPVLSILAFGYSISMLAVYAACGTTQWALIIINYEEGLDFFSIDMITAHCSNMPISFIVDT